MSSSQTNPYKSGKTYGSYSHTAIACVALFLLITATIPRLYHLGYLGFYGDEETSAHAAYNLFTHGESIMPSGLPYNRAYPLTALNALSAKYFGLDNEFSYRLPSAFFGILTIPLFFLIGKRYLGTGTALLATLILALSEWHILTSREARMYTPFLFFYLASGFSCWEWIKSGRQRYLILSAAFTLASISFHVIGLFSILFWLLPLATNSYKYLDTAKIILLGLACTVAVHLLNSMLISDPISHWIIDNSPTTGVKSDTAEITFNWIHEDLSSLSIATLPLLVTGIILGIWVAVKNRNNNSEGVTFQLVAQLLTAAASTSLLFIGHLYAATVIAIIYCTIHPSSLVIIAKKSPVPLIFSLLAAVAWIVTKILGNGELYNVREMFMFPFPYLAYYGYLSPGLMILFIIGSAFLAFSASNKKLFAHKYSLLMTLIPLLAIGYIKEWGGMRYLIQTYPFFIIVATHGMQKCMSWTLRIIGIVTNQKSVLTPSMLILLTGALGGHGLPQAFRSAALDYGDSTSIFTFGFDIYPDHRTPGLYVRKNLKKTDIVIAMDMLEQSWYAGQVDYWLTDPTETAPYLYTGNDNRLHDIYTGSIILNVEMLDKIYTLDKTRIWLITSAETPDSRLDHDQLQWLDMVRRNNTPVYTGRDGVTMVYCLKCP